MKKQLIGLKQTGENMDKNVKDFNVRLRTIRIRDLAVAIIISLIAGIFLMFLSPSAESSENLFSIVIIIILSMFFIISLLGTHGIQKDIREIFEIDTGKEILYVFAINILFACLFLYLISLMDMIIGFGDPYWVSMWDEPTISSGILIIDVIVSVFFAPILEELVFRGVIFNRLKIRTGIIPAMLISSFIFAIGHDFGGIISAFLFGICMCILYLKTDNIFIPMTVHFINNVAASLMETYSINAIFAQFPLIIPSLAIIMVGSILLIIYIIKEISKINKKRIN